MQERAKIWLKSDPRTETCQYRPLLPLFLQYAMLASFFHGIRAKINKLETRYSAWKRAVFTDAKTNQEDAEYTFSGYTFIDKQIAGPTLSIA